MWHGVIGPTTRRAGGRSSSSSLSSSPRNVQSPKPTNAMAAATVIAVVWMAAPTAAPTITETACTSAVARVMPSRTGIAG